jgi:hypothetical protein
MFCHHINQEKCENGHLVSLVNHMKLIRWDMPCHGLNLKN